MNEEDLSSKKKVRTKMKSSSSQQKPKKKSKSRSKSSKNNAATSTSSSSIYQLPSTSTMAFDKRICHTITSASSYSAPIPSTSTTHTITSASQIPPTTTVEIAATATTTPTATTESKTTKKTKPPKEKPNKNFSKFGPKTIKIMWEQYDKSGLDIVPEVFNAVADDVSYKVWELINNIKIYAKHCGGRVTFDLVNEVLRDSDSLPILGAGCGRWNRVIADQPIFFDSDKIIELRDEYLKEIESKIPFQLEIIPGWMVDKKNAKHLLDFTSGICKAIFLSDQNAFNYGIDAVAFSPHIACCIKLLFRKCIEILAFDQTNNIIERCLKFLQAISVNPYARDVEIRQHLFHLAEIIICLLLDTIKSIKVNVQYEVHPKLDRKEESFELVKSFLENSDQDIKKDVEALNQMDVDDIRSEYEALFQMMERDGFQEREHTEEDIKPTVEILHNIKDEVTNINNQNVPIEETNVQILNDEVRNYSSAYVIQDENNFNAPFYNENEINLEFSPYTANMMDFKYVDMICRTIGCLSSQFGYFQTECIYIIIKRMEKFFIGRSNHFTFEEYQYISRCVRGLIALGEFAFREMTPFIYSINPEYVPEWMYNDFSLAAVFLNGPGDIFLYEWLQDLCGADKLQPFMIHSYRYHDQLINKVSRSLRPATFRIVPKVLLQSSPKIYYPQQNIYRLFPEKVKNIRVPAKIGFKFSGCRPVLIKLKSVRNDRINEKSLKFFNSKIRIGKRKLMKPLTNQTKLNSVSSYCFTQL